jgi:hypothetical protein
MRSSRLRDAYHYYYYDLDPSRYAHVNDLYDLADELEATSAVRGADGNLNANIHLEISLHPDVLPNEQIDHAFWADELLSAKDSDGQYLVGVEEASAYRIHMPFFKYGWTDDAKKEVRANLDNVLTEAATIYTVNQDGGNGGIAKGFACESAITLMVGHTGLQGLMAYPSFERQNRNHVRVDDKSYRWDVSVFSDGTTLEQGEYPIQVKSSQHGRRNDYHPNIIGISIANHLSIPVHRPHMLASLCERLIILNDTNPEPRDLHLKRKIILGVLEKEGPVQPAPHTLTKLPIA